MHESQYTRNVLSRLPADTYAWKINDNFEGGVPDSCIITPNAPVLFIEWKYTERLPKREDTILYPKVSQLQQLWLKRADNPPYSFTRVGFGANVNNKRLGVLMTLDEALQGFTVKDFLKTAQPYGQLAARIADEVDSLKTGN